MKSITFMGNTISANDCAETDYAFDNNTSLEEAMLIVNKPSDLTFDMVYSGLCHILGRRVTSSEVLVCLPPQAQEEI